MQREQVVAKACTEDQRTIRPEISGRSRAALIAVSLVLLPTFILAGAWRLGGASALEDDLLYYLPIRQYIGQRVATGELPLWNPLVGMGTSLAADPQSGLWYPATFLFAVLPPLTAYPLTLIAHFALAGWGMYRLCRASGRDWQAAFLGAIAFEFCGFLIAHRVHLTMHHAVAWIPWMLFGWRRLAETGKGKYFGTASAAFGLQMLVQHTQISIMSAILVSTYTAVVLLPERRSLLWQYPLGMIIGAAIGAVQTLPTLMHLGATGRGMPTFAMFVENSWVPTSALMLLFPMLFGNRTPTFWGNEWWGLSHFCEQFAYGSIVVLVLAVASWRLVRIKTDAADGARTPGILRREVWFWWGASLLALVIALGEFSPISRLLFHVPIYRNLRVPARWILVWSLAMPMLASAVVSTIHRGGPTGARVASAVRWVGMRLLPGAVAFSAFFLLVARWRVADLEAAFGHRWGVAAVLAGLKSAVRPGNPAILLALLVMVLSIWLLWRWMARRDGRSLAALVLLMVVDLAGVAAFVDIDTRTYRGSDLVQSDLADAIRDLRPDEGHRLLVPRFQADYDRPLEVLWPQTNMLQGISTFNAYGPFWPRANRLLFRFMPWGSSEAMLELLRNRPLCAAMGIRFLAARTTEEHEIIAAAMTPRVAESFDSVHGTDRWMEVVAGGDILWPVRVSEPGIYAMKFEAAPGCDLASQCFVRLETPGAEPIGFPQRLEPVDLSEGNRQLRLLFVCPEPVGDIRVRIKSVFGHALSVRNASLGRIASLPTDSIGGRASSPPSSAPSHTDLATSSGFGPPPLLRTITEDGVSLFECADAVGLVRIAPQAQSVPDLAAAVAMLLAENPSIGLPGGALYEWPPEGGPPPVLGGGSVSFSRPGGGVLHAKVACPMPALLVFNESFDPGWSATINGNAVAIRRVNAVAQGVIVPSGVSEVTFRYRPPGLAAGLAASIFGWAALFGGAWGIRPARIPR